MAIGDVGLGVCVIALFVVLVVFGPLILIFGANFILEAWNTKKFHTPLEHGLVRF